MKATVAETLANLDEAALRALAEALRPYLGAEPEPDALLTPQEAARRASVHVETIRRAVRSGALPSKRVGRGVRIAGDDLKAWLTPSTATPAVPKARRRAESRRPLADALSRGR